MKYPEDFINKVICGDSQKLIKYIPDNSIDLIFTDPPYSLGFGKYDNSKNFYKLESELWRVIKPNRFLVFYWSTKKLGEPFLKLKKFQYCWQIIGYFPTTYSKSKLGDRKYMPLLVFMKGDAKLRYRQSDLLYAFELPIVVEKIKNPLFKPTAINCQILQMFSLKNDLIFDPFCGFGSIPLVCKVFNRRFIGIDIDSECIEIAQEFIAKGEVSYIGTDMAKRRLNETIGSLF